MFKEIENVESENNKWEKNNNYIPQRKQKESKRTQPATR